MPEVSPGTYRHLANILKDVSKDLDGASTTLHEAGDVTSGPKVKEAIAAFDTAKTKMGQAVDLMHQHQIGLGGVSDALDGLRGLDVEVHMGNAATKLNRWQSYAVTEVMNSLETAMRNAYSRGSDVPKL